MFKKITSPINSSYQLWFSFSIVWQAIYLSPQEVAAKERVLRPPKRTKPHSKRNAALFNTSLLRLFRESFVKGKDSDTFQLFILRRVKNAY